MIKAGIEPFINLYHFDIPIGLQNRGGFESKEVIDLYVKYAQKCFKIFGDRIKHWYTFNEPIVPAELGYLTDAMYPNVIDFKRAIQVGYNTIVAHAKGVEVYKKMNLGGEIGIVLNLTPTYPRSKNPSDVKASEICDLFFNKSFLNPSVLGTFPKKLVHIFKEHDLIPEYTEEELKIIKDNTVDYLGVNYYEPRRVKAKESLHNPEAPLLPESFFDFYEMPGRRINPYRGWEIAQDIICGHL